VSSIFSQDSQASGGDQIKQEIWTAYKCFRFERAANEEGIGPVSLFDLRFLQEAAERA
jgi:hypothetical protein